MKTKLTRVASLLMVALLLATMLPMQAIALTNGGTGGSDAGELDWLCVSGQHYFDEGVVTTAATCTGSGVLTYTCEECGTTKTEAIAPLGHAWSDWSQTSAATCTENGNERRTCSRCDAVENRTITATGHTAVTDPAVAATCEATGLTAGSHCSVCGTVITAQTVVPKIDHTWDEGEITTAPGCNTTGVKTYTCTVCGATKTEDVAATGAHTVVEDAAVAATCTASGLTAGSHCSVCNTVIVAQTVVPALGHNMTATAAAAATCTEPGNSAYWFCDRCEKYFSDANGETEITANSWVIDALGHNYEAVVTAPTCTAQGFTTHTCSRCSDSYIDTYTDALGHTWNEGEVTTAAGCITEGVMTYTCTVCGATKTEAISATGHTVVTDEAVAPTCTETGLTEGSHCSVCNAVIVAQETIPATGHTVVEDAAVAATCTEAGKTAGSHCSVCGTVIVAQEDVPATGHTWVAFEEGDDIADFELKAEATTESPAVYYKNCSVCGDSAKGVDESATFTYGEALPAESDILYGDADGDGEVTSLDVVLLNKYFAGLKTLEDLEAGADVDGDNDITSLDVVLINKYFAGLKTLEDFGPKA